MKTTLAKLSTMMDGTLVRANRRQVINRLTVIPSGASHSCPLVVRPKAKDTVIRRLSQRGVPLIINSQRDQLLHLDGPAVIVDYPVSAFRKYVRSYRLGLKAKVIAITGTAGKTSTKDMLTSILHLSYQVRSTVKNFNFNPERTILASNKEDDYIVLEMGMNRQGHIAHQCEMAVPDVGIITNVGRGHLLGCGSFEGVIQAKNELVYGLQPDGVLILSDSDPGTQLLKTDGFRGKIIRFGQLPQTEYRYQDVRLYGGKLHFNLVAEGADHPVILPTPGLHHVLNATAAAAAARYLGISWNDIVRGLESFIPFEGRLKVKTGPSGATIIDDSYNANPLSLAAGLKTLKALAGGRLTIAVLGGMINQGALSDDVHREIGKLVADLKIDHLIVLGKDASPIAVGALEAGMSSKRVFQVPSHAAASDQIIKLLKPQSVVLVKGSGYMRMGLIVTAITTPAPRQAHPQPKH